jgi:hypothetical protein
MNGAGKNKRDQYDEAKRVLVDIHYELETQPLTREQREQLQLHAARLAGLLSRPWLPVPWSRRIIMAAILLFGLQQARVGNYQPLGWWLLLPFFSPRIMGECAYFFGVLSRPFRAAELAQLLFVEITLGTVFFYCFTESVASNVTADEMPFSWHHYLRGHQRGELQSARTVGRIICG